MQVKKGFRDFHYLVKGLYPLSIRGKKVKKTQNEENK